MVASRRRVLSPFPGCASANRGPTRRSVLGEQLVQLLVALDDAAAHAAADDGVARLHRVDERRGRDPGAAVAEVREDRGLERDAVWHALPGERLDQPLVRSYLVEGAVERRDLLALAD